MNRATLLTCALLLGLSLPRYTIGQMTFGFAMPKDVNRVEIPFTAANNLIVLPVVVNNFLKLNFILDTGVDTPILTEIAYANLLGIEYVREVIISGVGKQDSIRAYVGQKVNLRLPGNVIGHNLNLLVLQDDYLKLSGKMGLDVHGIIGYDLFKSFIVEVDYDERTLILHRPETYKPRRRFLTAPLDFIGPKPFITSQINQGKIQDTVRLMIDTGASHAVLLDMYQTSIAAPAKTISARLGTGLGGEIPGKLGRIDSFQLLQFEFKDVIVSLPEIDAYSQVIKRGSRQGTLGGDVLSRLYPIFDYPNRKLYLNKGLKYKSKFEFDMSGLSLAVTGHFLDTLVIEHVRENSPAYGATLMEGDIILSINGVDARYISFSDIQLLLRKKPNYKIRLKILRAHEKMRKEFRLRRAI
jgi:hypothetical protein